MARSFLLHSVLLFLFSGVFLSSQAQEKEDDRVDQLIGEGRQFYFRHQYSEAIERYLQGLKLAPQNVDALYELAWAYFELAEYPSSLEAATGASFNTSDEMDRIYALISLNYYYTMTVATYEVELNERTEEEVAYFRKAARKSDDGDEQLFKLGLTYLTRNDPERAITAYVEALQIRPDYMEAHWDLGKCYDMKGRLSLAAMAYAQAIASNPEGAFTDRILTMLENSLAQLSGDTTIVHTSPQGSPVDLARSLEGIVARPDAESAEDTLSISLYFPWYRAMIDNGHVLTFTHYLYQATGDTQADEWISANPVLLNRFLDWSRNYRWNGAIERESDE